jgi:hypothetical protein
MSGFSYIKKRVDQARYCGIIIVEEIAISWNELGSKPGISAGEWGLTAGVHSELQLKPEIPEHSQKQLKGLPYQGIAIFL